MDPEITEISDSLERVARALELVAQGTKEQSLLMATFFQRVDDYMQCRISLLDEDRVLVDSGEIVSNFLTDHVSNQLEEPYWTWVDHDSFSHMNSKFHSGDWYSFSVEEPKE